MSGHDALPRPLHERTDASVRGLAIAALCLGAGLLAVAALTFWLFPAATVDRTISLPLPQTMQPALQTDPRADMAAFRAAELRQLNSVGWIDTAHGIVHVPIADAMRAIARDGIADWPTKATP